MLKPFNNLIAGMRVVNGSRVSEITGVWRLGKKIVSLEMQELNEKGFPIRQSEVKYEDFVNWYRSEEKAVLGGIAPNQTKTTKNQRKSLKPPSNEARGYK